MAPTQAGDTTNPAFDPILTVQSSSRSSSLSDWVTVPLNETSPKKRKRLAHAVREFICGGKSSSKLSSYLTKTSIRGSAPLPVVTTQATQPKVRLFAPLRLSYWELGCPPSQGIFTDQTQSLAQVMGLGGCHGRGGGPGGLYAESYTGEEEFHSESLMREEIQNDMPTKRAVSTPCLQSRFPRIYRRFH